MPQQPWTPGSTPRPPPGGSILLLGTYAAEGLPHLPGVARLLAVYRDDPDAGVHGAAGWTLRQWGLKDKLGALDAELAKLKDLGGRRWYVNGQGQTFAVIAGPVEFRMGAPANEPDRIFSTRTAWMAIPRRFAIAATEVTNSQFQKFLGTNSSRSYDRYSPDAEGPRNGVSWYQAAHYCNWLSEQEGLPKEQWCYVAAQKGGYADGMTVPADVLLRTGYRLTEVEWKAFADRVRSRAGHTVHRLSFSGSTRVTRPTVAITRGRAAACCRTTWDCLTCSATYLSGCRTGVT